LEQRFISTGDQRPPSTWGLRWARLLSLLSDRQQTSRPSTTNLFRRYRLCHSGLDCSLTTTLKPPTPPPSPLYTKAQPTSAPMNYFISRLPGLLKIALLATPILYLGFAAAYRAFSKSPLSNQPSFKTMSTNQGKKNVVIIGIGHTPYCKSYELTAN
jgi:hypothetical protein